MSQPASKHVPYFELLESLRDARLCALCESRERSTHRYLESLLYESVNDPGVRQALIASHGFCADHAEALLSFGDGLGTALLYQDQVEIALEFLRKAQGMSTKLLRKKAQSHSSNHKPCPACVFEAEGDARRIGALLAHLQDAELRQALEAGPGLCMPHLLEALEACEGPEDSQYLLELHREKFARVAGELREFIRKQDYRFSHEEFGRCADSWKRAVRLLLGTRLGPTGR